MKKLAVLGASYLQLPLVEKAKQHPIEVHCFAWDDGKAVCKNIVDYFYDISVLEADQILSKCQEIGIDGIVAIATDICIPVIAYIAEKLNLIGNSVACAQLTTNKGLMRDCFQRNHILSPKHIVIKSADRIPKAALTFPLIVKPIDRSGSLGVIRVEDDNGLSAAIHDCLYLSLEKSCIVEEYISGDEVSVETLSWKGQHHILAITDKVVTDEPYFVEIAHHQPSSLSFDIQEKIKKISLEILAAVHVENGAAHIEYKITSQGEIYAIEIGSRMGGDFIGSDLVYLSTGFDYTQAIIDIALNQFEGNFTRSKGLYSGVYFLSKNTETLLPYFHDTIKRNFTVVKKEIQNSDLKYIHSSNDRSGFLIYQSHEKVDLL